MKLFCLETGLDSRQPLFLLFPPISRFKSLTHQKCCLCTCSRWKMSRRCSSPRLFKNWLMVMSSRAAEKKWCQQGFHKFWLVVQRGTLVRSPTFSFFPVGASRSICGTGGPGHRDVTQRSGQVVYAAGRRQARRGRRRRDDHTPCRSCAHHIGTYLKVRRRRFALT